ncbi:MAG: amino acid adenylation domain-containing protein [Pseudobutyrivibrio sp.]|nr:amino acid adenylation domain-containing protein [Pseudobutyrivibrio sp.]
MTENYSKALSLIEKLEKKGVSLWKEDEKIKFKANTGALQPDDIAALKELKSEVLELLDPDNRKITLSENKADRYKPFVLTDVQQSYLMGRSNLFNYGGLSCHIYLQLNYEKLDVNKVEEIWNYLIERHEMLRAVMHEEGYQQILEKAPHLTVKDYKDTPAEEVMEEMGHQQFEVGSWPYFAVGVSNYDDSAIMHFSIEFIIADWTSIWMLLHQFEELYFGKASEIPEPQVSFRDYVLAEKEMKESAACERDKHYWLSKLEDFPTCPQIDTEPYSADKEARFDRKFLQLSPELWENVKKYAYKCNVTPTALVLMAYAHTLSCYSDNKRFAINLTMLNRQPLHEDIGKVIGDFTTLTLLDIDLDNDETFIENVKRANMQLFEDMDHNLYSGVAFMRELANKKGSAAATMPYVFTSAVGLLSSMDDESVKGMVSGIGISQTPQVFIDCQVMDGKFGMQVNWDVRRGVFKDGIIDDMFELFSQLLKSMANGVEPELAAKQTYPKYQEEIFNKANDTTLELPKHLLHENILASAEKYPDKVAVVAGEDKYTYSQLMDIAGAIYNELIQNGVTPGQTVGIAAKKSVYQPAAALAILAAGAVYVPISTEQGANRIGRIIERAEIRTVVTLSSDETEYPEGINKIFADGDGQSIKLPKEAAVDSDSLAYIIFTSGSTGEPKGVAISHAAAVNTIEDIIRKYDITDKDSAIGVSQLSFDLSVFDIFGLLSVGGTVVYPEDSRKKEPEYLARIIEKEGVTVWNSVPSLLNMVMVYLDYEDNAPDISSLRLVMLSGDWIPLFLPDKLHAYSKDAKVVSLGGATEAAIWSIYHDYEGPSEGFASIPYGLPLANQQFRILDSRLNDRPVGVKGDIYILGDGLADGYYNDKEKTDLQFIKDPVTGRMMYKTGDIGKYHRNGEIEFLGRSDSQIKFNGHRIELGEIESAVKRSGVTENCSVVYTSNEGEHAMICFYEPAFSDDAQKKEYKNECNELSKDIEVSGAESINGCIHKFVDNYSNLDKPLRILELGADTTVLNVDKDILEQGYEENAFDIVTAQETFKNSIDISYSLKQIRRLVRPGGYFLSTEPLEALNKDKDLANAKGWQELLDETDSSTSAIVLSEANDEADKSGTKLFIKQFKIDRQNITGGEITSLIRDNLASYMIPTTYIMLDSMPVTANGKIDGKALKAFAEKRATAAMAAGDDNSKALSMEMNDLQKELVEILASVGLKGLGLQDSFYDHGADSLILAQATGAIRDKIIKDVPFDTVLRFMLNHPNIQDLSEFVAEKRGDVVEQAEGNTKKVEHIGAAQLYKAGDGPLHVVFHAAFGTMNSLRYVVENLVNQQKGDVLTISLGDADKYYQMDRETAIQQLADDYTQIILETGAEQIQLVGYCFGGWLATQCANRLIEQGKDIADMILIDCQTVPWIIEDRLMIEIMFLPNFGITLEDLGVFEGCEDVNLEKMFVDIIEQFGKIPDGLGDELQQMPEYAKFGQGMNKLGERDMSSRFELYAKLGSEKTGETLDAAMLEGVYKSYCQTIRCCNGDMDSYFGDIRFLNAKDNESMFYSKEKNIGYWTDICIGDIEIIDVDGDHYSCVENPEYAASMCKLITDY